MRRKIAGTEGGENERDRDDGGNRLRLLHHAIERAPQAGLVPRLRLKVQDGDACRVSASN